MEITHTINDTVINSLINTNLWQIRHYQGGNSFTFYSDMKGYSDGRYRLEITKRKKRINGKTYKSLLYWTPYNTNHLVSESSFETFEELANIIKAENEDLLDSRRKWK